MAARNSPFAVVRQLAPRAWCPLQCLLVKTVGVLSPGVGRSEECAQEFADNVDQEAGEGGGGGGGVKKRGWRRGRVITNGPLERDNYKRC